jgi:hypothetical protein
MPAVLSSTSLGDLNGSGLGGMLPPGTFVMPYLCASEAVASNEKMWLYLFCCEECFLSFWAPVPNCRTEEVPLKGQQALLQPFTAWMRIESYLWLLEDIKVLASSDQARRLKLGRGTARSPI